MTMYDYMTMDGNAWLSMDTHDCIGMHDYVWLLITMDDYVWIYINMPENLPLFMIRHDYGGQSQIMFMNARIEKWLEDQFLGADKI